MSDDALPELIDVTEESKDKNLQSKSTKLDTKTTKKEDEFKLVVSKRKRRELANKMDDETDLADKSTMDDTMNEEYDTEDEELLISQSQNAQEEDDQSQEMPIKKLKFPPISAEKLADGKFEMRKVHIPPNRYNPLKENWMKIYTPVVEYLKLQIRFNLKTRNVELRVRIISFIFFTKQSSKSNLCKQTCPQTAEISSIQKAADFIRAFALGFEIEDALALVRLDDLFLETFEILDGNQKNNNDFLNTNIENFF